ESPDSTSARRSSRSPAGMRRKRRSRSTSARATHQACPSRIIRSTFSSAAPLFKNFSEPLAALREMHRVLKPGGTSLIIDLRRDASREAVNQLVDGMGVNAVNEAVIKLTFSYMLLKRAYT